MHRFIPIYAKWQGAKVTEVIVNHFPRVHGESKYGLSRIFKVILDIFVVTFLNKYLQNLSTFLEDLAYFFSNMPHFNSIYAISKILLSIVYDTNTNANGNCNDFCFRYYKHLNGIVS